MNTQFKAALLSEDTRFYDEVCGNSYEEKDTRLNVYRNNIFVSLIEALSEVFPITQALVGSDFFHALAKEYLITHPPKSPVLWEYGDSFSDFIRTFEPAKSLPYLPDLAALEHALLALTNAQEYPTLQREQIAATFSQAEEPGDLYLSLPPTTQILTSPYAIGTLYHAHMNDGAQRLNKVAINTQEYLLLIKSHLYAQLHVITLDEALFIKALLQHKKLEEALPESDEFDLGVFLAKLIDWQVLTRVSTTG